jgi:hypothetical protein
MYSSQKDLLQVHAQQGNRAFEVRQAASNQRVAAEWPSGGSARLAPDAARAMQAAEQWFSVRFSHGKAHCPDTIHHAA